MYKNIVNPENKQYVNINSSLGRIILKKYTKYLVNNNIKIGGNDKMVYNIDNIDSRLLKEFRPVDNIQTIYGCISLDYHIIKNGDIEKKILLIGDYHSKLEAMPVRLSSPRYLFYDELMIDILDLLNLKNECLDIMIEDSPTQIQFKGGYRQFNQDNFINNSYNNSLYYIRNLFRDCGTKNYLANSSLDSCIIDNKTYNNLRVHNIDLRLRNNMGKMILDVPEIKTLLNSDRILFENILKFILNIDNIDYLYNKYGRRNYIYIYDLLIDKLPKYMLEKFLDGLNIIKTKIQDECEKLDKFNLMGLYCIDIKKILYNYYTSNNIKYKELEDNHFRLVSIIFDIYFWLRFLKIFDISKLERGPKECRNEYSMSMNKIIIFAGYYHTDDISNILSKIFDSKIFSVLEDKDKKNKKVTFSSNTLNVKKFKNFKDLIEDFVK